MITETFKSKKKGLREYWLETPDGWCIYSLRGGWFPYYDHRFDIATLKETEDKSYPTYNDLISVGALTYHHCCGEDYDYYVEGMNSCKDFRSLSDTAQEKYINTLIDEVRSHFEALGITLSRMSILHNFYAWVLDHKSGYRDEVNGYHVFTPCGCNPLRFTVSRLHRFCKKWQVTYPLSL